MTAQAAQPDAAPHRPEAPSAPHGGEPPERDSEAARAACRELAATHYENFHVLSALVPARLRDDFAAVYAFCRLTDDLADETGSTKEARAHSLRLLAWARRLLVDACAEAGAETALPERIHTGERRAQEEPASREAPEGTRREFIETAQATFPALAATIRMRGLPVGEFHHLIDAFEQDQRVTRWATWESLIGYCKGSANPVGRLVLGIAGYRLDDPANSERVRRSDAICTALQLTNFWQDVRRDLVERDRVYMPQEETGLSAETLREWLDRPNDPGARAPFIRAMRPLLERTRALYREGAPLVGSLDREIRPVVFLFGAGGRRVLGRVERLGGATLWRRPTLTKGDRALLLLRAMAMRATGR